MSTPLLIPYIQLDVRGKPTLKQWVILFNHILVLDFVIMTTRREHFSDMEP